MTDVHVVSISKALEWIKAPVAWTEIDDFVPWQPEGVHENYCNLPRSCRYDFQGSER